MDKYEEMVAVVKRLAYFYRQSMEEANISDDVINDVEFGVMSKQYVDIVTGFDPRLHEDED